MYCCPYHGCLPFLCLCQVDSFKHCGEHKAVALYPLLLSLFFLWLNIKSFFMILAECLRFYRAAHEIWDQSDPFLMDKCLQT